MDNEQNGRMSELQSEFDRLRLATPNERATFRFDGLQQIAPAQTVVIRTTLSNSSKPF
jgi:hypothetical protein